MRPVLKLNLDLVTALSVPPVMGLLSTWFISFCDFNELLQIILTPLLWISVGACIVVTIVLFDRQLCIIEKIKADVTPEKIDVVRRSKSFIPKFFLVVLSIYCLFGPNAGMFGICLLLVLIGVGVSYETTDQMVASANQVSMASLASSQEEITASAEQAASASEELAGQALKLKSMVEQFQLKASSL